MKASRNASLTVPSWLPGRTAQAAALLRAVAPELVELEAMSGPRPEPTEAEVQAAIEVGHWFEQALKAGR